jgi:hypothetical protein
VAAWFPDMLCIFYSVKNHKIANNSAITQATEKISTDQGYIEFYEKFYISWTKIKSNQIIIKEVLTQ